MNAVIEICNKQVRVKGRLIRIGRLEADKYLFLDDPAPFLEAVRDSGTRIDLFTFMSKLPGGEPYHPYCFEMDNFAAIPITTFEIWWNQQLGFKARNKAKQAEKKGVVIREVPFNEHLVKGIWGVYNETEVRQGARNTHYGKNLETVYREEATFLENSTFIGAYLGEELIGFIKMVQDDSKTQAGLMNIVSMIRHRDKAPTNALVAHAVRVCAERGISYLVYSNFAYANKERSTLSDFKERNGFQRINVPRYYVPLTPLGRVALRLGLQHKLTDHLPESVVAQLRRIRAAWYNRKLQSTSTAAGL
jgi:hypothetical protein